MTLTKQFQVVEVVFNAATNETKEIPTKDTFIKKHKAQKFVDGKNRGLPSDPDADVFRSYVVR